jgi:Uma2 family endonuclease
MLLAERTTRLTLSPYDVSMRREHLPFDVRMFSVDEYHRMIEAGIFNEDDNVELLEGWIVKMAAMGRLHRGVVILLDELLRPFLPNGWHIAAQASLALDTSEPEPDLAIVRGDARSALERKPIGTDVGIVIEVADTSLEIDRTIKSAIYARNAIPIYWIVNLEDNVIEVFSQPDPVQSRYQVIESIAVGERVTIVLDGTVRGQLDVAELLPDT